MGFMPRKLRFSYPYIEDFGGTTKELFTKFDGINEGWTAFNPSIGYSPSLGYAMTVRSSNYLIDKESGFLTTGLDSIRSEVWFSELDDNLEPINLRKLEVSGDIEMKHGIEDARLIGGVDGWELLAVVFETYGGVRRTRLAKFVVDALENTATHVKTYNSWDTSRQEKNWMPLSYGTSEHFEFVYSATGTYKNGVITAVTHSNHVLSDVRGGTQVWPLGDGTYFAVTHSVYYQPVVATDNATGNLVQTYHRTYTHQFVRLDSYGRIMEISEEFFFDGPDVEFAMGLVSHGDDFVITYGREDASCNVARIPKSMALGCLSPVED